MAAGKVHYDSQGNCLGCGAPYGGCDCISGGAVWYPSSMHPFADTEPYYPGEEEVIVTRSVPSDAETTEPLPQKQTCNCGPEDICDDCLPF